MRNIWSATVLLSSYSLFFHSCQPSDPNANRKLSEHHGGTLRIAEGVRPATLFPHMLTTESEALIASQIYEGLVRLHPRTLEVIPALAESWEISPDEKTITFHLRKDARFQNDSCYGKQTKGPEVHAEDVKYTFERLCTQSPDNYHFATIFKNRLVGADAYYEQSLQGKPGSLKGFKLIDEHTFSLELLQPGSRFLQLLANPVAAILNQTLVTAYGPALHSGAGPFLYDGKTSSPEHVVLRRNPDYYGSDEQGHAKPYLDSVIIDVLPTIENGLSLFKAGKLDVINTIPSASVNEIVEENIKSFESYPPKYILDRNPEMITQYYAFNLKQAPYNDLRVRQAINYAIDRNKLVDDILRGQAFGPGHYGITSPTFKGYDVTRLQGYTYDPKKAKKLLAEAGYPNGKGFPELRLIVNSGSSRQNAVAIELQKQLQQTLHIPVSFESLPNEEKSRLQNDGRGDLFRDGWIADYPSPESFLSIFYGEGIPKDTLMQSFPNTSHYQNATYDALYKAGRDAADKTAAYQKFMQAEQTLLNDAPILVLWYEGSYRIISGRLQNFFTNPMRHYDLSSVYIQNPQPKKKENS